MLNASGPRGPTSEPGVPGSCRWSRKRKEPRIFSSRPGLQFEAEEIVGSQKSGHKRYPPHIHRPRGRGLIWKRSLQTDGP